MKSRYWTCSRFADWLRGTMKPKSATAEEWDEWYEVAKKKHPVRYWLAEEGLDYIQDFITWPTRKLYDIKYYVNNRWVTRTHQLTAHVRDIRPGHWCDVGNRFLPCLFNELVDFVEIELAWWHIAWAGSEGRAKYGAPFWATGWFRWRTWRSRQAGLDSLAWQKTCDNRDYTPEDHPDYGKLTQQAYNAMEIEALYLWWTEQRPQRQDPMEVSGWSAYCEARWNRGKSILSPLVDEEGSKVDTSEMHRIMNDLEAQYEREDEEMMIRLIKVRQALWT